MRLALGLALVLVACGDDGPPTDPAWMTPLADEASLAELSIPGTHDSAALYEPFNSGTAKTQNLTIEQQLEAGIRFLDIRCRHLDDAFQIYHGPFDQQQSFDQVLATVSEFLDAHPKQTVIMSVKEEFTAERTTRTFGQTFEAYVEPAPERWHLGAAVPTVGDARGKIVLLRRFPSTTTPLGIDGNSMWGDDKTFTMTSMDATVRVQDDYKVETNDSKWMAITTLFAEAAAGEPSTWFVNFTSGFQLSNGIPNTPRVATDINERLDEYLNATPTGRLGTVASDFTTESRIHLIIAHNQLP